MPHSVALDQKCLAGEWLLVPLERIVNRKFLVDGREGAAVNGILFLRQNIPSRSSM